jgi:hypothetical protein
MRISNVIFRSNSQLPAAHSSPHETPQAGLQEHRATAQAGSARRVHTLSPMSHSHPCETARRYYLSGSAAA